jgi:nucleoside-diphosphate-sugar epimerase
MILLTGASGFIGKHLLKALINKYGKDKIVALTSKPIIDCDYLLHNNYSFAPEFFIKNGYSEISTVIHAGAYIPKNSRESNIVEKCNENIKNSETLINATLPALKNFILLSTVDVYGNDEMITEKSTISPVSLYGLSKYYTERMIEEFFDSKQITYQILRIGHVYGPGEQEYQKLIPVTIKKVLHSNTVDLYGTGEDIRTFIYISDVVEAILKSLDCKFPNEIINVVGQDKIMVKDLIQKIIGLSNRKISINTIPSSAPGRNLVFDNSKLRQLLHAPSITLDEGLQKEIDYFKSL